MDLTLEPGHVQVVVVCTEDAFHQIIQSKLPPDWKVVTCYNRDNHWVISISDPLRNSRQWGWQQRGKTEDNLLDIVTNFAHKHHALWTDLRDAIRTTINGEWIDAYTPAGDRIKPPTVWGRAMRCLITQKGPSSVWLAAFMPGRYDDSKDSPQSHLWWHLFFRYAVVPGECKDHVVALAEQEVNPYTEDGALDRARLKDSAREVLDRGLRMVDRMKQTLDHMPRPTAYDLILP